ncbi:MAG TPA: hypothetical protein VJ963_13470, partial [Bacteroidales bacterium]|nr:hypothetical protein [Bacteroidales bacterium]
MPVYSEEIRVVFSVTNSVCYDQRVLKMAGTIKDMGCVVTIIGRLKHKNHGGNIIPFSNHRFRMLFTKGFLFYTFFNLRLFFYLLFIKCDILVANDLDTLLPSFIVSRIRKLPLIYDSHEYFTGVPELSGRKFVTKVWET